MDSDLSHEALNRFARVEANIKKLLEHNDLTSVEEDQAKAAEESAKAAAPAAPVDPRDAEIEQLKAQLAAKSVSPHDEPDDEPEA